MSLFTDRSPALELGKNLVSASVLATHVVDDLLNDLVPLALLLQVSTGLLLRD